MHQPLGERFVGGLAAIAYSCLEGHIGELIRTHACEPPEIHYSPACLKPSGPVAKYILHCAWQQVAQPAEGCIVVITLMPELLDEQARQSDRRREDLDHRPMAADDFVPERASVTVPS